jgi:sulfur-carrier protein
VNRPGVPPGVDTSTTMIRIPGPLRGLAAGEGDVEVRASTVGAALDELVRRHPGLLRHLRTERGALREHVNIYVNEDDIRTLRGEATALAAGDTITVVPSIAGG